MHSHHRRAATVLSVAALAVTAAACGGAESASKPAQAPPAKAEPVAQIDQLSGRSTAVKLDTGFVGAL